jgi:uncharacterized protein (TIGR03086 family)
MMAAPRLVVTTPSDCEIAMTRTFNAPRRLVFEAYTQPELLKRWLGPRTWTMVECSINLTVGGTYRYVWQGPGGAVMGMGGVYREIVRPERIVATELFDEAWYRGEGLGTCSLTEVDGVTTLTLTVRYESQEVRDAVLKSPMEGGLNEGFDRLTELLAASTTERATRDESEVAARYRRRADIFEQKVAAVQPDRWGNQSPCTEWNARDVVRHIVFMHGIMIQPLGRSLSAAPTVDDNPLAAFKAARTDVEAVLADPALAGTEAGGHFGTMTVEQSIDNVISMDMVLHGWDLAKATGQDATMDPDEVARSMASPPSVPEEVLRSPGVMGPIVPVPEDAPIQDRLLGFLGRDPHWSA